MVAKLRNILLLVVIMQPISCRIEYTGQLFTFPPGTKPHLNDWVYTTKVVVSSRKSPTTALSKKKVQITVYNRDKTNFLKDEYHFRAASINAKVIWNEFEEIKIELYEEGNPYSQDSYNANLVKEGPNSLLHLTYRFNEEAKKFKRTN